MLLLLLAGVFCIGSGQIIGESPVIETDTGPVIGQTVTLSDELQTKVHSFWGIPFAASPTGELRFARPEKRDSWDEVFVADSLPPACPQNSNIIWMTHPGWNRYDEDCLNLNVFTPEIEDPDDPGDYPVMVWMYGGAYTSGGNVQYPGHFLAAKGVVVVVPNYRIGNLGWTTTGDSVARGNWGLWDQNFALEWVKDNIRAFGGDPNQVTIFGQSAGGSSSSLHMISPHSRPLFDAVIAESGTDFTFWSINWPAQQPESYTREVAGRLDCPNGDNQNQEMIDCLRDLPWEVIYNVSFPCTEGHFCQGMAPVIDGPGGFIPQHPIEARDHGNFAHVPLLTMLCREDGSPYTAWMIPEANDGGFNRTEFLRCMDQYLLSIWNPQFPEDIQELVHEGTGWHYAPWPHIDDLEANRHAFNMMITDAAFAFPADKQAKSQSKHQDDVFEMVFGYRSTNATGFAPEWIGTPHAGELPYIWGWTLMKLNPQVRLDSKMVLDIFDYHEEDFAYTDFMQDLWTNFAKTHNPTPEPVTAPTGEQVTWDRLKGFDVNDLELNVLLVDNEEATVIQDYRQKDISYMVDYMAKMIDIQLAPEVPGWPEDDEKRQKRDAPQKFPTRILNSDWFDKGVTKFIDDFVYSNIDDLTELEELYNS